MSAPINCRACKPVVFRHEDGVDIYRARDCEMIDGHLVPFFVNHLVEDARNITEAKAQLAEWHPFGVCLA